MITVQWFVTFSVSNIFPASTSGRTF